MLFVCLNVDLVIIVMYYFDIIHKITLQETWTRVYIKINNLIYRSFI